MLDFLDGEILRVGHILGGDTPQGDGRDTEGEQGLHGSGLGNGIEPHGVGEVSEKVIGQG